MRVVALCLVAAVSPATAQVIGGLPAETCELPQVVAMRSGQTLCTGSLIHPQVIAYAAHCGDNFTHVYFGEKADEPQVIAEVAYCERNTASGLVGPDDFAVCVLEEPAPVRPIPIAFGCEEKTVLSGADVTIVGFGDQDAGTQGRKYWAETRIATLDQGMLHIGGGGKEARPGDSGAPAFATMIDGTARVAGFTSGGILGEPTEYVPAWTIAAWTEGITGFDVTPCHDLDGSWNPGPDCGGFPYAHDIAGSWPQCLQTTHEVSSICGAHPSDSTAPTLAVDAGTRGSQWVFSFAAQDADRVAYVQLWVDGKLRDTTTKTEGTLTMEADGDAMATVIAVDGSGNETSVDVELDPSVGTGCESNGSSLPMLALALFGFAVILRRR